jgi:hypothetical protein
VFGANEPFPQRPNGLSVNLANEMTPAERDALAGRLTRSLLELRPDDAYDQIRVVFLEDEEAIPEISHDFGKSGFDELAFEALYARLIRASEQQLRRLARRLGVQAP